MQRKFHNDDQRHFTNVKWIVKAQKFTNIIKVKIFDMVKVTLKVRL